MPEFILNNHSYYSLDDFARGYVEAMFFTNGDIGDDTRENLLNDLGVERLTRDSVKRIKQDCSNFLSSLMPDGTFAQQWIVRLQSETALYGEGVNDDRRAGHMFWYARQGHGVGWSDDYSESATADGLQEKCSAFGECHIWVNRGWIHVEG